MPPVNSAISTFSFLQHVSLDNETLGFKHRLPIELEANRGWFLIKAGRLLSPRQCLKFWAERVPDRQECLLPMEDWRIGVARIIRVPRLAHGQVDAERKPQGRMRIGFKLWVSQKRQLQLIGPEFDRVELRRNLVARPGSRPPPPNPWR